MPGRRKSSPPRAPDEIEDMPEPVVDPHWRREETLAPWERSTAAPRSRPPRPRPELIERSNAAIAQTRAGKVLTDALAKPYPGDKPTPQRPLAHYHFLSQDVRGRLDALAEANELSMTERVAVLRYAIALFDEDLGTVTQLELPSAAPHLWSQRSSSGIKLDPAAFTREVYGSWLGRGLTRRSLRDLDPDLYRALSVWEHRHPEDRIAELPTLAEEIDAKIAALADEFTPDELRRLGSTLQTRHRRAKK